MKNEVLSPKELRRERRIAKLAGKKRRQHVQWTKYMDLVQEEFEDRESQISEDEARALNAELMARCQNS